ncbi:5'-nucleotidase SurE [Anaplasma platys]|uniref:5'-nucleotidase SurE n=1 Tax=Anaplasma platys TaxID=949 RepID=A0A858PY48_9RICK|nr:5'/3'-nucleotidase SurE [Anaplasma platys]QJC27492.1 5'-nucleotidase SurE [Anaplasma platys]
MRVLLTNDDGINAPGMQVLKGIACGAFSEVWVSAPSQNCSGMSRSINVNSPIEVVEVGTREYSVTGTPVDSAILGLHIMNDVAGVLPDLVLSGINYGSNVASKLLYSGTVAAAAVAAGLGIPSIAFSQGYCGDIDWKNSEKIVLDLVQQLMADPKWNRTSAISINIPSSEILGVKWVEQGTYCPFGEITKIDNPEKGRVVYNICDLNRELPLKGYDRTSTELLREGYVIATPVKADYTDHSLLSLFAGVAG